LLEAIAAAALSFATSQPSIRGFGERLLFLGTALSIFCFLGMNASGVSRIDVPDGLPEERYAALKRRPPRRRDPELRRNLTLIVVGSILAALAGYAVLALS
jgi:hypothetical protein